MSVPTHNLYHFINQVTENKFWLKYFYPWGEKDLEYFMDLQTRGNINNDLINNTNQDLHNVFPSEVFQYLDITNFVPVLACHDQEPLDFDFYDESNLSEKFLSQWQFKDFYWKGKNKNIRHTIPSSYRKKWILLHSECNSKELEKYESTNEYIGAHWWSHALISRDWYRYAEHDLSLNANTKKDKMFLVYCRDTTGKRQYRQSFYDQIHYHQLEHQCVFQSFNPANCQAGPDNSATYVAEDFNRTWCSVVLETCFEDRIHLTEKTLRPIATGHPFILAAGKGALEYIKSYGFKTFSPWINEDYDNINDSDQRLKAVVKEIKRLSQLSFVQKQQIFAECHKVAAYNKKLFFSAEFFDLVVGELYTNITNAHEQTRFEVDWYKIYYNMKNKKLHRPNEFWTERTQSKRPHLLALCRHVKKGGTLEDYEPPWKK